MVIGERWWRPSMEICGEAGVLKLSKALMG